MQHTQQQSDDAKRFSETLKQRKLNNIYFQFWLFLANKISKFDFSLQ